jgi:DHA2 family multidrug resistance protein
MTPPVGWLSTRYGRKSVFLVSLTGFVAASMLCGASESLVEIVLFRILQGLFGAALVPLSQSTILDIFPPAQRAQAMAIWVMGVIVGPILGPTLGGYLTDFYNWRWVFYINLPLGILTVAGLWIFMKNPARAAVQHFDFMGFAVLNSCWTAANSRIGSAQQKSSSMPFCAGLGSTCSSSTCSPQMRR